MASLNTTCNLSLVNSPVLSIFDFRPQPSNYMAATKIHRYWVSYKYMVISYWLSLPSMYAQRVKERGKHALHIGPRQVSSWLIHPVICHLENENFALLRTSFIFIKRNYMELTRLIENMGRTPDPHQLYGCYLKKDINMKVFLSKF